jgi:hypothetical protein
LKKVVEQTGDNNFLQSVEFHSGIASYYSKTPTGIRKTKKEKIQLSYNFYYSFACIYDPFNDFMITFHATRVIVHISAEIKLVWYFSSAIQQFLYICYEKLFHCQLCYEKAWNVTSAIRRHF